MKVIHVEIKTTEMDRPNGTTAYKCLRKTSSPARARLIESITPESCVEADLYEIVEVKTGRTTSIPYGVRVDQRRLFLDLIDVGNDLFRSAVNRESLKINQDIIDQMREALKNEPESFQRYVRETFQHIVNL